MLRVLDMKYNTFFTLTPVLGRFFHGSGSRSRFFRIGSGFLADPDPNPRGPGLIKKGWSGSGSGKKTRIRNTEWMYSREWWVNYLWYPSCSSRSRFYNLLAWTWLIKSTFNLNWRPWNMCTGEWLHVYWWVVTSVLVSGNMWTGAWGHVYWLVGTYVLVSGNMCTGEWEYVYWWKHVYWWVGTCVLVRGNMCTGD